MLILAAIVAVHGLTAAPTEAQEVLDGELRAEPVRWEWGGSLSVGAPVGEFARYVEGSTGFGLIGIHYLAGGRLGVRVDLTMLSYGKTSTSHALSLSGVPVDVDVVTQSAIASLSIGPHLLFGRGQVRPYLGGSIGSAQFVTDITAWSGDRPFPIARAAAMERYALELTTGGGIRVTFRERGHHPVSVELGGHYKRHGTVEYVREGGVRELPDGRIELDPITSNANLWTIHAGAAVGFR